MRRTNLEIQKELDEQKYYESIRQNRDMSGKMEYCMKCKYCDHIKCECTIWHEKRFELKQCAKASKVK